MTSILGLLASAPSDVWRLGYVAGTDTWTGVFQMIVRAPVAIVVVVGLIHAMARRRFPTNALLAVLAWMFVQGSIVGLLARQDAAREWVPYVSGCFGALLMLAGYSAFLRWQPQYDSWLEAMLSRGSKLLVLAGTVCTALFLRGADSSDVYWALVVPMTLPFSWFLSQRKYFWAVAAALLVLINGKRGIALEILYVLMTFSLLAVVRRRQKAWLTGSVSLVVVLLGVVVAFYLVSGRVDVGSAAWLNATIGRYQMLLDPQTRLSVQTSGRSDELTAAWGTFNTDLSNWLVGGGHGWQFWAPATVGSGAVVQLRYVHLSPANYLFQYGLFTALAFFGILAAQVIAIFRWLIRTNDAQAPLYEALFLYVVASLAGGLTGYTYVVLPFIWISLGLLRRRTQLGRHMLGARSPRMHYQARRTCRFETAR